MSFEGFNKFKLYRGYQIMYNPDTMLYAVNTINGWKTYQHYLDIEKLIDQLISEENPPTPSNYTMAEFQPLETMFGEYIYFDRKLGTYYFEFDSGLGRTRYDYYTIEEAREKLSELYYIEDSASEYWEYSTEHKGITIEEFYGTDQSTTYRANVNGKWIYGTLDEVLQFIDTNVTVTYPRVNDDESIFQVPESVENVEIYKGIQIKARYQDGVLTWYFVDYDTTQVNLPSAYTLDEMHKYIDDYLGSQIIIPTFEKVKIGEYDDGRGNKIGIFSVNGKVEFYLGEMIYSYSFLDQAIEALKKMFPEALKVTELGLYKGFQVYYGYDGLNLGVKMYWAKGQYQETTGEMVQKETGHYDVLSDLYAEIDVLDSLYGTYLASLKGNSTANNELLTWYDDYLKKIENILNNLGKMVANFMENNPNAQIQKFISQLAGNQLLGLTGNERDLQAALDLQNSVYEDFANGLMSLLFSKLSFATQRKELQWINGRGFVYDYVREGGIGDNMGDNLAAFRTLNNIYFGIANQLQAADSYNYKDTYLPQMGTYDPLSPRGITSGKYWAYSKIGGGPSSGWIKSKYGDYYIRKNLR